MLPRKIATYKFVPFQVRKVFYHVEDAPGPCEEMFQHVVGRAVMDALGFTGLDKPHQHNTTVRAARVWLKFSKDVDDFFEFAGVRDVKIVRDIILETKPFLKKDDDTPKVGSKS